MPRYLPLVFSLVFFLQPWRILAQTCYFPNGAIATNDIACTNGPAAICCEFTATCLDNELCFNPFGSAVGGYIRGSCTDISWESPSCPRFCNEDDQITGIQNIGSDAGVVSCGNSQFCCESANIDECDCQTLNGTFSLAGDLLPFTKIPASGAQSSTSSKSSLAASSTTSSTTSATILTASALSTASLPTTATTPQTTAVPSSTNLSKNDSIMKIGLGVGIPVGIILLAILGLLAFCLHHRRFISKRQSDANESSRPELEMISSPGDYKPDGTNRRSELPATSYWNNEDESRAHEVVA